MPSRDIAGRVAPLRRTHPVNLHFRATHIRSPSTTRFYTRLRHGWTPDHAPGRHSSAVQVGSRRLPGGGPGLPTPGLPCQTAYCMTHSPCLPSTVISVPESSWASRCRCGDGRCRPEPQPPAMAKMVPHSQTLPHSLLDLKPPRSAAPWHVRHSNPTCGRGTAGRDGQMSGGERMELPTASATGAQPSAGELRCRLGFPWPAMP